LTQHGVSLVVNGEKQQETSLSLDENDEANIADDAVRGVDDALEALLGRAVVPVLSVGFAERVVQAVTCESAVNEQWRSGSPVGADATDAATGASKDGRHARWWARAASVAAALALGSFAQWIFHAPSDPPAISASRTELTQEDVALLQAVHTNALSMDDLALVTKLGEVLEDELTTSNALWSETE